MTETQRKKGVIGRLIGLILVGAAVVSVFLIDWDTSIPAPEPQIRPLKTIVIGETGEMGGRKYPGKVRANQEVSLAFQVAGPLVELPVKKSQEVAEGELLARIDPRDYQNALDAAEARFAEAASLWERMQRLYEQGHAQEVEYEEHRRSYNVAKAEVEQARKNLEDTHLRAPFAGVIANRFVENFENVQAKQVVLSLQDVSKVEIEVNVPEKQIMTADRKEKTYDLTAEFENLPGRVFPVELKEFETEADPMTQTFVATMVMDAPEDVNILPGMTASITARRREIVSPQQGVEGHVVPTDAVAFDGTGAGHVWLVKAAEGKAYSVHRVDVKVGPMQGDEMVIEGGVKAGDRIAAAGVHLLHEGQRVRLFSPETGGAAQ